MGGSRHGKDCGSKTTAQLSLPWFLLVSPAVGFGKPFPHARVWHSKEANILILLLSVTLVTTAEKYLVRSS